MKSELDPHGVKKSITSILTKIDGSEISDRNKELILRFYEEQAIDRRLTSHRSYKYLQTLFWIAKHLQIDFDKATQSDLRQFMRRLRVGDFHKGKIISDWSMHDYVVIVKHFFRWLHGLPRGQYPEVISWLEDDINKTEMRELARRKLKENYLSPEELEKLRASFRGSMYRFFLELLIESGCRVSELLTLCWGNIKFSDGEIDLEVRGKTGLRNIPALLSSVPAFKDWLRAYPLERTEKAPVFIITKKSANGSVTHNPLSYATARRYLSNAAVRAGLSKTINPHLFRKMAATEMASKGHSEYVLTHYFGWSLGSPTPGHYITLSADKVRQNIKRQRGDIQRTDEKLTCMNCHQENVNGAKACVRCGALLDRDIALKLREFGKMEKHYSSLPALDSAKTISEIKDLVLEAMRKDFYSGRLKFRKD